LLPFLVVATTWQHGDACPTSIKTTVPGNGYWNEENEKWVYGPFGSMEGIHRALSSCRNTKSLDLRVTLLGCSEWPDRFNFPFSQSGGETYSPLTSLKLEGYSFLEADRTYDYLGLPWYERVAFWFQNGGIQKTIDMGRLSPGQLSKKNVDLWLDAMDWSKIETLALVDLRSFNQTLVHKIVPHLRSVRDLDLSWNPSEDTLSFVMSLSSQSLAHFTQRNFNLPGGLHSILTRHGESLETLKIFSHEIQSDPSPIFNHTELADLTTMAPKLRHLSINVHRNGTWPLETFQTLASIPSLRSADLYLDITSDCRRQQPDRYMNTERHRNWVAANGECDGKDQFQKPWVDERSASEMFAYMREKKVGEELQNVTFWVGDWQRSWDGPLYFPDWLEHKNAKVVCSS
ncbi:hypothetical protein P154DRAFT_409780, partial [Amniculicola lignicola CBS 123094]